MPRIIRAEYLSYYSRERNSDKLFNIFLIEETDGTFSCLTENGRRGSNLVRRALCTGTGRATAESKFRQKLDEKRYHRDTPYAVEVSGVNYSQIAREYAFNQTQNEIIGANQTSRTTPVDSAVSNSKNVLPFPASKSEMPREQPKKSGILNQEQLDSLEL